ncbi:MAG: PEP-CTERM sorting domain-containing protein [Verrucomicrobiota bacterium]|nr:PEP-CTERM sorting domain-containing protein [Verrucomicrobiota bacterium]
MKALLIAGLTVALVASAHAITLGQLDNFESTTLQGWGNGGIGGSPVPTVTSGGPGGAADHFLQIASDSSGAGSRLTVFNRSQWLGNYIAFGVTAIEVDLRNSSNVTLSIRLAFKTSLAMGAPAYLTQAAILAPNSGWQHFTFSLAPANMIGVLGPPSYSALFSGGMTEVRFINEAGAFNATGDIVTAQLGIDNIHAVPEPATIYSLGAGLTLLAFARARRRAARRSIRSR